MNQCMPKLTKTSAASKTHISWDFSLARLNYTLSAQWIAWAYVIYVDKKPLAPDVINARDFDCSKFKCQKRYDFSWFQTIPCCIYHANKC